MSFLQSKKQSKHDLSAHSMAQPRTEVHSIAPDEGPHLTDVRKRLRSFMTDLCHSQGLFRDSDRNHPRATKEAWKRLPELGHARHNGVSRTTHWLNTLALKSALWERAQERSDGKRLERAREEIVWMSGKEAQAEVNYRGIPVELEASPVTGESLPVAPRAKGTVLEQNIQNLSDHVVDRLQFFSGHDNERAFHGNHPWPRDLSQDRELLREWTERADILLDAFHEYSDNTLYGSGTKAEVTRAAQTSNWKLFDTFQDVYELERVPFRTKYAADIKRIENSQDERYTVTLMKKCLTQCSTKPTTTTSVGPGKAAKSSKLPEWAQGKSVQPETIDKPAKETEAPRSTGEDKGRETVQALPGSIELSGAVPISIGNERQNDLTGYDLRPPQELASALKESLPTLKDKISPGKRLNLNGEEISQGHLGIGCYRPEIKNTILSNTCGHGFRSRGGKFDGVVVSVDPNLDGRCTGVGFRATEGLILNSDFSDWKSLRYGSLAGTKLGTDCRFKDMDLRNQEIGDHFAIVSDDGKSYQDLDASKLQFGSPEAENFKKHLRKMFADAYYDHTTKMSPTMGRLFHEISIETSEPLEDPIKNRADFREELERTPAFDNSRMEVLSDSEIIIRSNEDRDRFVQVRFPLYRGNSKDEKVEIRCHGLGVQRMKANRTFDRLSCGKVSVESRFGGGELIIEQELDLTPALLASLELVGEMDRQDGEHTPPLSTSVTGGEDRSKPPSNKGTPGGSVLDTLKSVLGGGHDDDRSKNDARLNGTSKEQREERKSTSSQLPSLADFLDQKTIEKIPVAEDAFIDIHSSSGFAALYTRSDACKVLGLTSEDSDLERAIFNEPPERIGPGNDPNQEWYMKSLIDELHLKRTREANYTAQIAAQRLGTDLHGVAQLVKDEELKATQIEKSIYINKADVESRSTKSQEVAKATSTEGKKREKTFETTPKSDSGLAEKTKTSVDDERQKDTKKDEKLSIGDRFKKFLGPSYIANLPPIEDSLATRTGRYHGREVYDTLAACELLEENPTKLRAMCAKLSRVRGTPIRLTHDLFDKHRIDEMYKYLRRKDSATPEESCKYLNIPPEELAHHVRSGRVRVFDLDDDLLLEQSSVRKLKKELKKESKRGRAGIRRIVGE